jgi:hemerythrin-like domain-containing protein
MHPLISELHQDHVNLGRLLGLLQRELDRLRSGESPDYFLLIDVIDYIESYPDQIHHPREDVIFRVYLASHQSEAEDVKRLMEEHESLVVESHQMRRAVEQVTQSAVSSRDALETQLAQFIARQWDHLNLEEGRIFRVLSESLTEAEWRQIEADLPSAVDPIFGGAVQQRYQAIYDQIMIGS